MQHPAYHNLLSYIIMSFKRLSQFFYFEAELCSKEFPQDKTFKITVCLCFQINNPDMRVQILKDFVKQHFPSTTLLDYALDVEKITTSKVPVIELARGEKTNHGICKGTCILFKR